MRRPPFTLSAARRGVAPDRGRGGLQGRAGDPRAPDRDDDDGSVWATVQPAAGVPRAIEPAPAQCRGTRRSPGLHLRVARGDLVRCAHKAAKPLRSQVVAAPEANSPSNPAGKTPSRSRRIASAIHTARGCAVRRIISQGSISSKAVGIHVKPSRSKKAMRATLYGSSSLASGMTT